MILQLQLNFDRANFDVAHFIWYDGIQSKLVSLASVNSEIRIIQPFRSVPSAFLWRQTLANLYKVWHKWHISDSTTDDWLPQPRKRDGTYLWEKLLAAFPFRATASSYLVTCQLCCSSACAPLYPPLPCRSTLSSWSHALGTFPTWWQTERPLPAYTKTRRW